MCVLSGAWALSLQDFHCHPPWPFHTDHCMLPLLILRTLRDSYWVESKGLQYSSACSTRAWASLAACFGVRCMQRCACLLAHGNPNFRHMASYDITLLFIHSKALLTHRRRHVVRESASLPPTAPCSPQRVHPEPSYPQAGTSCATHTACARCSGRTWAAGGGGRGAR